MDNSCSLSEPPNRADNPVEELITTERNYINNLNAFFFVYVKAIEAQNIAVIPSFLSLCNKLEVIKDLHVKFYDELYAHNGVVNLGQGTLELCNLFTRFAPFFRIYSGIISHIETTGREIMEICSEYSSFKALLKECRQDPRCFRHTIHSFLIMPVQRIPRYALLLKTLLHNTPTTSIERVQLEKTVSLVEAVLQQINQGVHDIHSSESIIKLHKKMPKTFDLFSYGRRFIMKSKMGFLRENCVYISVTSILFSDALVIVKKSFLCYKILKTFSISTKSRFVVKDVPNSLYGSRLADGSSSDNRIFIQDCNDFAVLQCQSEKAQQSWKKALQKASQKMLEGSFGATLIARSDRISERVDNQRHCCRKCSCDSFKESYFQSGCCLFCQHEH
uniref:DH domain-containing protein n=1 Tax=Spongospora subterranea TaxID=70186 RepID=A0A0H5QZH9_9EUKA|eukprot:CRZ07126.1 hypothetical protein [Spongospora subterranea]